MLKTITKTCRPFLLSCTFCALIARGQPPVRDSLPPDTTAYTAALSLYHTYLAPETSLYRGDEYASYGRLLKSGYPYYGENGSRKGEVFYNGILYHDVFLSYDLVYDQVIMDNINHIQKIRLVSPQVDYFTIGQHYFIHLRDSLNPTAPRNGFYEQLYKGRILLLKKETKAIQEELNAGSPVVRFIDGADTAFYLKIGAVYHSVNTTRSLLHMLKDRKKDVRNYIRANDLDMRLEKENTLIKVVTWYDSTR
jgi:hypothetical protein